MESLKIVSLQSQNFSIPSNYIYYMLKNLSSYFAAMKLYKTCKYFSLKKKLFFTIDLHFDYDDKYYFEEDVGYWLGGNLRITACREPFPFHYIYRCSIKEFSLLSSTITLSDFLFIVKENTIKKFSVISGLIKNSNGTNVSMDFVLQKLPNVEYFIFDNEETTQKQLQNIEKVNLWNKLKKFNIDLFYASEEEEDFDPMPLLRFIQNNAAYAGFYSQIIIDGKNSQKNYENLKDSAERLFYENLKNGNYTMEIYDHNVPRAVLVERIRKQSEKP